MPAKTAPPPPETPPDYDRFAIFAPDAPIAPAFVTECVRCMLRALPLDDDEPKEWADRRLYGAILALSAMHPRDEIEMMLAVQAVCAYHAASAGWYLGMNRQRPCGDSTRHVAAAASAARTFDTLLKALERRQAKPLSVPLGRPPNRDRPPEDDAARQAEDWEDRAAGAQAPPPGGMPAWTPQAMAFAADLQERERIERETEGLDIANTQGILPDGGMIVPAHPTPQQKAYIGRRIGLAYQREHAENLARGLHVLPKVRRVSPGDLVT